MSPPCRVCGSSRWVAVWWPDKPEEAICVECCGDVEEHPDGEKGHQYERLGGTTHCKYCGSEPPFDYYDTGDLE